MNGRLLRFSLAILLTLTPVRFALAEDECKGPSGDCVAIGRWNFSLSLGAGVRTDPVVHQADIPLAVIPQFSYYGKHFFIDNLDAGVTLVDSGENSLSLIASPGYDRVFFYRGDPQNIFVTNLSTFYAAAGVSGPSPPANSPTVGTLTVTPITRVNPDGTTSVIPAVKFPPRTRQWTYLAGPEWTFKCGSVTGQLDILHEITGHSHGEEVRAALGIPLSHSGGSWTTDIGLTWKSSSIVNYYYGAPDLYQGRAALDPFIKLTFSRPLTGKWKFTAFVESERLGDAIAESPIINARYVTTAFMGATYSF